MNYATISPILLAIEGPDRLGKSNCVKSLADYINVKVVIQPSKSNSMAFLRPLIKESKDLTPFERQLLCAFSHVEDFHKVISSNQNLVYDRSHLSTLVYSKVDGIEHSKIKLLKKLFQRSLNMAADGYQVHVVVLTRDEPFGTADNSYQEQNLSWTKIRDAYLDWYENDLDCIFSPFEQRHLIDVGNKTKEEVLQTVLKAIQGVK